MSRTAEPVFDFVKRKLHEHKGNWRLVSSGSGVPYDTLTKIALGRVENPRINTVQKLTNYFSRHQFSTSPLAPASKQEAA